MHFFELFIRTKLLQGHLKYRANSKWLFNYSSSNYKNVVLNKYYTTLRKLEFLASRN